MVETRGGGGGGGGCTAYTSSRPTVDVPTSRVGFFYQGLLDQGSVFHMFPLE